MMPLYEYRCPAGHVFERRASFDQDVTACVCGEAAGRAEVNRTAVIGAPAAKYRVTEMQEAAAEAHYYRGRIEARG